MRRSPLEVASWIAGIAGAVITAISLWPREVSKEAGTPTTSTVAVNSAAVKIDAGLINNGTINNQYNNSRVQNSSVVTNQTVILPTIIERNTQSGSSSTSNSTSPRAQSQVIDAATYDQALMPTHPPKSVTNPTTTRTNSPAPPTTISYIPPPIRDFADSAELDGVTYFPRPFLRSVDAVDMKTKTLIHRFSYEASLEPGFMPVGIILCGKMRAMIATNADQTRTLPFSFDPQTGALSMLPWPEENLKRPPPRSFMCFSHPNK